MMSAGALRERVLFQREVLTGDGGGGFLKSWSDILSVRAAVTPLTGRERDMASQTEAGRNYRVRIYNSAAARQIREADRIVWGETVMNIRFIARAGSGPQYLDIDAESGVAT